MIHPGIERIASIVRSLSAGFAYVPFDIAWLNSRMAAVLLDPAPEVVVTSSHEHAADRRVQDRALNGLKDIGPVISLPNGKVDWEPKLDKSKLPSVVASDLAYIMHIVDPLERQKGYKLNMVPSGEECANLLPLSGQQASAIRSVDI